MSHAKSPFRPGTVALVLLVGAVSFLLLLFAMAHGLDGSSERDGRAHAKSRGLDGYAGFVSLLENSGHTVSLSYSEGNLDDYGLLVLTPRFDTDGEELAKIIEQRRYMGPTMLVLPKWIAMPIPDSVPVEAEPGWVVLANATTPSWFDALGLGEGAELAIGETGGFSGLGYEGTLPDGTNVMALVEPGESTIEPLVVDREGDMLAGLLYADDDAWPLVIVFEPDLVNNWGMADETRARLADAFVHAAEEDEDLALTFDMTLPGLAKTENLLTLAFTPPFLAATLCLILAALLVAWRAFQRFGPPFAEAPAMAQGKRQLAMNGAALLARLKRWHLLGAPYAALVAQRIASRLSLREPEGEAREHAIDRALIRAGHEGESFGHWATILREASKPADILRASRALRSIERTLTP
ncbi:DUF4350 domain-containing protein [Aurantiacibacter xanthus]|uniref:DUF4350 domain-containing protein n=1 Tax=Aurantiacibacter xanthus TaxID=1784712 RepID=A0A3A1NZZ1_9SPHN|nr:DUF4350 domain-containing protein [Aurantiacibacter xanthus]RIV81647.1 DUF4350 domain-containing protein [Aurantiacibacter xanthus]